MGLHRAGFDVVGFDTAPQPRYPFEFHQQDALTVDLSGFDAVWASPTCQAYSVVSAVRPEYNYPDLIAPTRQKLNHSGKEWLIENVPGAPLDAGLMLCGSMFGLRVKRHRLFEASYTLGFPPFSCNHRRNTFLDMYSSGARRRGTERQYCDAMGVTWAPVTVATESIPPAYSEYLGRQLMAVLSA